MEHSVREATCCAVPRPSYLSEVETNLDICRVFYETNKTFVVLERRKSDKNTTISPTKKNLRYPVNRRIPVGDNIEFFTT
jgi:hypothetical protein